MLQFEELKRELEEQEEALEDLGQALGLEKLREEVEEFLADCIRPLLEENRALLGEKAELSV